MSLRRVVSLAAIGLIMSGTLVGYYKQANAPDRGKDLPLAGANRSADTTADANVDSKSEFNVDSKAAGQAAPNNALAGTMLPIATLLICVWFGVRMMRKRQGRPLASA